MASSIQELLDIVTSESQDLSDLAPEPSPDETRRSTALVPEVLDSSPNALHESARAVKAAFIQAKDLRDIYSWAKDLPPALWMDFFIKLSPKEVKVEGQFDVRQMVAQMGPVKRNPNA